MAAKDAIKAGDTVELKSGGLPMTVGSFTDDKAAVFWFDDEAMLRNTEIPAVALIHTNEKWGDDDIELDDDDDEFDDDDDDDEEEDED